MSSGRQGALWCIFLLFVVCTGQAWGAETASAPAAAPNPDDVLATIGDTRITRADLMKEIETFKGSGGDRAPDLDSRENKLKFLQQLVEVTLLELKAGQAKTAEKPELEGQIRENSIALLASAYLRKVRGDPQVGKADVDAYYQKNKDRFSTGPSYHLFQMTVETPEAAEAAKKDLEAKKSFAEVATARSVDTFKSSGGDRGFVALGEMHPMVSAAVSSLAADQVSGPLKGDDGKLVLVKYSEKKDGTAKPLEEVATSIEKELKDQKLQEALETRLGELEKEFSFKLDEKAAEILRQPEFKPEDAQKPLFTIGTETVTIEALMPELERIPPFIRPAILGGEGLQDFLRQFCHRELIKRYVSRNYDALAKEFPDVMRDARRRVSLKAFLDEKVGNVVTVSDDEIKDFYSKNLGEFAQPEQVRAHHILVDSEEKAKGLLERLNKNEKFEDLAKTESKCPSGKEGGDLGFFGKGQMVPEFDQVAQTAEIGKVVGPVKTQFGFHLVRVDERKAAGTTPLEEVKDQIKSRLLPQKQRAAFEKLLEDLKKEFPVKESFEKL
ncbi:MAG: hypothetical protein GX442_17185 [Candidatus Riflebacteria bacterium]|nr:hypothetical protein [Candidatus Riflebacteria bacterium]